MDWVCECPALPLNVWHHPATGWDAGRAIGSTTGEHDGLEYIAGGFDGWVIICPDCDQVYGWGAGVALSPNQAVRGKDG